VDDGVSIEDLGGGHYRIWAHIADPSRLLLPGSVLDSHAASRSTSVYLPDQTVMMFPKDIVLQAMSLMTGQVNNAMSFGLDMDASGAPTGKTVVAASRVRCTYQLSYEEADELIGLGPEFEPELCMLSELTSKHRDWRRDVGGAQEFQYPDSVMKVKNARLEQPDISFNVIDWTSSSRSMVAECMIAAGGVAGAFGSRERLALPYRGQNEPNGPSQEELQKVMDGPARLVMRRSRMTASTTTTSPARHASLGLDAYVQVTSPIRRYVDLLAHYQLKAHLHGRQPVYSESEMNDMIQKSLANSREAMKVQRETEKYWCVQYFAQQPKDTVYSGILVKWIKEDSKLGLVLLDETVREILCKLGTKPPLGSSLLVKCTRTEPANCRMQFLEVNPNTSNVGPAIRSRL